MEELASAVRKDFPILNRLVNDRPLVYLDNAATTQIPEPVLHTMIQQYHCHQGNVHRGIHTLSERSTQNMENARALLRRFLGANHRAEIIFTSGTTQSINLVARSLAFHGLGPGDEVLVTGMEHHANLIPWQEACRRTGARLNLVPITPQGELDRAEFARLLSPRTRIAAFTWVSNVTGAINPVEELTAMAHRAGALVLVDGAQAVRHFPLDMKKLDCDFFCLSGHKMMGPTGTGVLYGKQEVLERLVPETFGGGMVDQVWTDRAAYGELPFRLEAGTPNIVGNIGLGAAADYLMGLGAEQVAAWELELLDRLVEGLLSRPDVKLLGSPDRRAGCVSFQLGDAHPYDAAQLLDQLGIAVRSGHHCAQPLLTALGAAGAVRASPAFYNTSADIESFFSALDRVSGILTGKGGRPYGVRRAASGRAES